MNCTVIKLNAVVNDDALPILGALTFDFESDANGAILSVVFEGNLNIRCVGGTISKNNIDYSASLVYESVARTSAQIYIKTLNNAPCKLIVTGNGLKQLGHSITIPALSFPTNLPTKSVKVDGLINYPLETIFHQDPPVGRYLAELHFNVESVKLQGFNGYNLAFNNSGGAKCSYGEVTNMLVNGYKPYSFQVYSTANNYNVNYKATFDINAFATFIGDYGSNLSTRGVEALGDLHNLLATTKTLNSFSVGASNSNVYIQCTADFRYFNKYSGSAIRVLQPMTAEHNDNFLKGLALCTFSVACTITIKGTKTSASDAAIATLNSKGVTVTLVAI